MAGDFARRLLAIAGLVVLAVAALDTLLAPLLISTQAAMSVPANIAQRLQGPSGAHLLGTDELGRDELARLLLGVHYSLLLAGAALVLAAVVSGLALAAVRLVGRERARPWGRWAEVVLTPLVGMFLLGAASVVTSGQVPNVVPNLFSFVATTFWSFIQSPASLGAEIRAGEWVRALLGLVVVGEVLRLVYLLVQRIRGKDVAPAPAAGATSVPGWWRLVGPAVVVGLWIAGDTLLLEPHLAFYGVGLGLPSPPLPSLSLLLGQGYGGFGAVAPWLVVSPFLAVLVLYVSCNLVGFGLRRVWDSW
jgi:peptide/nickel transport system permease protein